jgi:hypothetical protein
MTVIISGDNGVSDVDGSAGTPAIRGTDANTGIFFPAADTIAFSEGGAEAMRIDSSGNLLVGKTSQNSALAGCELLPNGTAQFTRDGNDALRLNRLTSDGDILEFNKDGTTVGSISNVGGKIYLQAKSAAQVGFKNVAGTREVEFDGGNFYPVPDDTIDLGAPGVRWDDVYATNGTIQTSDRNEKQDIEELTEAETRVAVAAKALMRKYRWKSAVAEKGDEARIHFGIIAQDLQAAFEAEGLDAGRYAMFIHSAWWEKERVIPAVEAQEAVYETQTDEDGNEVQVLVSEAVEAQPERTVIDIFETEEEGAVRKERMGVRYNELLAFIIAAI